MFLFSEISRNLFNKSDSLSQSYVKNRIINFQLNHFSTDFKNSKENQFDFRAEIGLDHLYENFLAFEKISILP